MKSLGPLLSAIVVVISINVFAYSNSDWVITKPKWTPADEKAFQSFVVSIGTAVEKRKCSNVTECFKSEANPYRTSDPVGLALFSDCADFPYFMRGYFAWKNGLPFSFANRMQLKNKDERRGRSGWRFWERNKPVDIRYSVDGNLVAERFSVINRNRASNAVDIFNNMIPTRISSANYRTDIDHPTSGDQFSDFYSIVISRQSIVPGTVIYDPNGHVTLVYKITDDGRIYYVDAHPDNGLTTGVFNSKFMRSNSGQGGGFKGWRPIELVGYSTGTDGTLIGGRVQAKANSEIPSFSSQQYFGNVDPGNQDHNAARFIFKGNQVDYYEFVRLAMSVGDLKFNPVKELEIGLIDLCESVLNRVQSIEVAIKAGIHRKSHPDRLPYNIYGTDGEWEVFSTPSRDAILKTTFKDLNLNIQKLVARYKARDPQVEYAGTDLFADLLSVYQLRTSSCQFTYQNSLGQTVKLNLEDVRQRLFKLSFDPYHCIELRWGAVGQEAASCQDDQNKKMWYEREQRLRNQIDRKYDQRMDFNLSELAKPLEGNGVTNPPDVDLPGYLQRGY